MKCDCDFEFYCIFVELLTLNQLYMKKMGRVAVMGYFIFGFIMSTEAMEAADSLLVTHPGTTEDTIKYLISSVAAIIATALVTFIKAFATGLIEKKSKQKKS